MGIKKVVKKLLPKELKEALKKEIGSNTSYVLNISDVKKLENKIAVVTGGSGAIGSALCFRLAMEGATVGVGARSLNKAEIVINNIKKNGGNAFPVLMDLIDDKSIDVAFEKIYAEYGPMDILVNNAGGSARNAAKNFEEQDFSVIDTVLNINLRGTMYCTYAALKHMKRENTSRIINMSSIVGLQGKRGMTDYAASKAGLLGFTRSLTLELGKTGITVNSVSPGWVSRAVFDKGMEVQQGNVNCMGHSGKTDDVAGAVAFLVSEEANYITGQNIIIDGGRSLGLWGDN